MFLAETVETGTKNHCMIEAMHVLGKIKFRAFPESIDYFVTREHY